jgi:hypothetical protein
MFLKSVKYLIGVCLLDWDLRLPTKSTISLSFAAKIEQVYEWDQMSYQLELFLLWLLLHFEEVQYVFHCETNDSTILVITSSQSVRLTRLVCSKAPECWAGTVNTFTHTRRTYVVVNRLLLNFGTKHLVELVEICLLQHCGLVAKNILIVANVLINKSLSDRVPCAHHYRLRLYYNSTRYDCRPCWERRCWA